MTELEKHNILTTLNPEIKLFVEEIGGTNPSTRLPYGEKPIPPEQRRKLSTIARTIFSQGRIYTPNQAVSLLEERLRISRDRAVNGFRMMMSSGVLSPYSETGIRLQM